MSWRSNEDHLWQKRIEQLCHVRWVLRTDHCSSKTNGGHDNLNKSSVYVVRGWKSYSRVQNKLGEDEFKSVSRNNSFEKFAQQSNKNEGIPWESKGKRRFTENGAMTAWCVKTSVIKKRENLRFKRKGRIAAVVSIFEISWGITLI